MSEGKDITISTNESYVAKIIIAWEITGKIYYESGQIKPNHIIDLYNLVLTSMGNSDPIDQTKFEALISKDQKDSGVY